MIESFLIYDEQLFHFFNQQCQNIFFDTIMPFIRNKKNWIPLYIFLSIFFIYKFQWKKGIIIILMTILTVGVSDTISSKIIKPQVERPRPCHDNNNVTPHLLISCGGGYSFTSSHATNHFAIATFLGLILLPFSRIIFYLFLLWATAISFAQIYVGVHYPLDVFCGGILGSMIGYLMFILYKKRGNFSASS